MHESYTETAHGADFGHRDYFGLAIMPNLMLHTV